MEKLPVEILKEIFFSLHQIQQVECMTVCRKWELAIKEFCLFRSVHITNRNQLERLQRKLEQESTKCEQVERVFLNAQIDRSSDLGSFLRLFPYPKVIYMPTANVLQLEKSWCESLECFCELNSTSITYKLLDSGIYSRLESVAVYRDGFDMSSVNFIKSLANAPALKRLQMKHFSITIEDLELLHTILPTLCLLDFDSTTLFGYYGLPDSNIEPAISVTSLTLHLDCIEFVDTTVNLFKYISKKYTNLTEAKFYISLEDMTDDDDVSVIYHDGMVPLLQRFGSQLKKVSLFSVASPRILLEMLDEVDYHLESLDIQLLLSADRINEPLGTRKQLKYITTFKLMGLSSTTFHWLSDFIVLKELDLTFSQLPSNTRTPRPITLNRILEACPETLESITIANVKLIYEPSNIQLPFVKRLYLRDSILASHIDIFISKTLPHLRYLGLEYCQLAYKQLSFPDLNLDYLEINDIHKLGKDNLLVITSHDDEQQLYAKSASRLYDSEMKQAFLKYDSALYPFGKRILDSSPNARPFISVACASVNNVVY
ncbi:hypothetical protein K501DRAFT_327841 [Backusella circina FSU 941]|nr:hypothetical protein K501DRAFT_327841 [Backusella circina FSU 941]